MPITRSKSSQIRANVIYRSLTIGFLLLLPLPSLADETTNALTVSSPVAPMSFDVNASSVTFTNGGEFPGAKGSAEVEAAANAIKINYDFTKGGEYVAAVLSPFSPIMQSKQFKFEIKISSSHQVFLRIIDASGQTFQFNPSKVDTAKEGWMVAYFNLSDSPEGVWGGDNSKKLTFPITAFSLGIERAGVSDAGTAEFRSIQIY